MRFLTLLLILFTGLISLYSQNFKFVTMSDTRGSDLGVNSEILSVVVDHIIKHSGDAKFLLFPGDLVDGSKTDPDYTERQLLKWKEVMKPIYDNPNMIWPKIWLTVGNHEVQHREDEETFRRLFPNVFMNGPEDEKGLTYSFDYDKAHFVFVTSDRWYYGDPKDTTDDRRDWHYIKHLDWLRKDLSEARARNVKWIFVQSHEPAFPIGGHLKDALPNLGKDLKLPLDSTRQWYLNQRDEFWNILKEHKVTAYICGHEHLYGREEVEGVYQIVSGSAGAPLYYFNPKYGEKRDSLISGMEIKYEDALPYYQVLQYNYKEGGNAQKSNGFVGYRAFGYSSLEVLKDKVVVKSYGAPPVSGKNSVMDGKLKLIDEFVIY